MKRKPNQIKHILQTTVRQQGASDCGVACLRSVLRYYGGNHSLERLRELSGTTAQGTTLLGLVQGCASLGLTAKGLKVSIEYLRQITAPVILPVIIDNRQHHYIVVYPSNPSPLERGRGEASFLIHDPARGLMTMNEAEMRAIWQSEAVLELHPNADFIKEKTAISQKKQWFFALLAPDYPLLVVAIGLGLVISVLGLATAIFSQRLLDEILPKQQYNKLYIGLTLLTILLIARAWIGALRGVFLLKQSKVFNERVMNKFYSSLLYLPKSFFDTRKTGEMIARMNDTRRIQSNLQFIIGNVVIDILAVLISVIFIFTYHIGVGIVVLVSVPVYIVLAYRFTAPLLKTQQQALESYAYNESNYVDTIQGIATIKSLQKEPFFVQITQTLYQHFQGQLYQLGRLGIRFNLWAELIGIVFLVGVLGYTAGLTLTETLQVGQMMAVISMIGMTLPAVIRLVTANLQLQDAKVAFDRMYEFAGLKPEMKPPNPQRGNATITEEYQFESLTVQNLSFRFVGVKPLLKDISFTLNRGEIIAFLGESGSGKSTLLQLLQRFYNPEKGEVLLNNTDWNKLYISDWRRLVGIVPQEIKLFNGTILENICLDNPKAQVDKVVAFIEKHQLQFFFAQFPQNILTLVGEQGINLSGGQRQMIALVRALYHQPQILLLDEFTSAMDKTLEEFAFMWIERLKTTLGIILITHQRNLAEKANNIYTLENGLLNRDCKLEPMF